MAERPRGQELLGRRLELVADISRLNAEMLGQLQSLGATEMDILRLELEVQRTGNSDELARDLREAERKADVIRAAQTYCEARIALIEDKVEEIDRQLASIAEEQQDQPP